MGKKIAILFLVVLILGFAAYFLEHPFDARFTDRAQSLYPALKAGQVARMEIEHLNQSLRLQKEGDGWKVGGSPADTEKVQRALEAVNHLKRGEPVSVNPDKQSQYELTDAAMKVRLFDEQGKKLAGFLIGKQGPSFQDTYFRDENGNEVYLAAEYLKGIFNTTEGFWK